jgi:hypothetical protein
MTYVTGHTSPAKKDEITVSLSGLLSARSVITKAHVLTPIKNQIIAIIPKPIVIILSPSGSPEHKIKKTAVAGCL